MWGAGYPVQASFVPPGGAANPFVPAQHAWAQQQGRFSYGAQQAVQAAYGQSSSSLRQLLAMEVWHATGVSANDAIRMFTELLHWFEANGGQLSPGVTVQQSALGGWGVFHDFGAEAGETILALPLDACLSSADNSVIDLPVSSSLREYFVIDLGNLGR
eukprot:s4109_g3.t1